MKAFVQSKDTQLYLAPGGAWVEERTRAMEFKNASEALDYCLEHKIKRTRIILNFGKNEYDLDLDPGAHWPSS